MVCIGSKAMLHLILTRILIQIIKTLLMAGEFHCLMMVKFSKGSIMTLNLVE